MDNWGKSGMINFLDFKMIRRKVKKADILRKIYNIFGLSWHRHIQGNKD